MRALPAKLCAIALLSILTAVAAPCRAAEPEGKADVTAPAIPVAAQVGGDERIRARIAQLFAALDGLEPIAISVSGGVVTLSGEAPSAAAQDQAVRIARRVEGVVEIRDRIEVSRDLRKRLARIQNRIVEQALDAVAFLPLVLVAAVTFALFWWLSGVIARGRLLNRHLPGNPFIRDLLGQAIRFAVIAVGLLLALEVLDASTLFTSLLGAAGVVGLAVGFALRDTVENYIASLLLSLRQPFARDDLVTIDGFEGRVVRLNARATVLLTLDGNHLRIPNAKVYKAVIVNFTRNPKRRFHFDVGVDTEQNLAEAQLLAATTVVQMRGVLASPPPRCTVEALGDSNVVLRVFGWVDQTEAEFVKVRSEAIRLVKGAFDRADIVMPEPIYNLRIAHASGSMSSGVLSLEARTEPSSPRSGDEPLPTPHVAEPPAAIDVERADELAPQLDTTLIAGEEDLLHPRATRE